MSRNIPSMQELIAKRKNEGILSSTPKFLSKKERKQLESLKNDINSDEKNIIKKRPIIPLKEEDKDHRSRRYDLKKTIDDNYAKVLSRNQKSSKRFKFEWKDDEDTLKYDDLDQLPILDLPIVNPRDELTINNDKHWSEKSLVQMKSRDWRILKEDFEIIIKGSRDQSIQPLRYWEESGIPKMLLEGINKLGYINPTPVQRVSVPFGLKNHNLIGIAETGSGKTLAFSIPMLSKLLKLTRINEYNRNEGPYSLILVPTRELAQQIESELHKLLDAMNVNIDVISIVGGKLIEKNILDLSNKNIEIIIATPGRLIDCLERHYLVLNQLKFLILDESDKMIEMNFKDQILKIKDFIKVNSKIQNFFFTATMNLEVEKILKTFVNLDNLITLQIGDLISKDLNVNDRIQQNFEFFQSSSDLESKKLKKLMNILRQSTPPVIIFVNYKETGEFLLKSLGNSNFKCTLIHGSKSQEQRELALEQFKSGKFDILIGTNVASRGIDINNISLVINYQMSKKIDDYVHRIGRTGRAGNYGTAVTFLNDENDEDIYKDLKKLLVKSKNKIPNEFRNIGNEIRNLI
ncbi:hypothetical protein WICMUC_003335 [Wickerhamomyces mucosus]|uniref:RNA helicase n=1 Tax=Wickerhamomyces mucosus TaxID=1378264 RepID=A0A9P8PMB3_9ASCO|nr:hypothetical protein WICMUC_003335 [Wickerhamomyces mucosus]